MDVGLHKAHLEVLSHERSAVEIPRPAHLQVVLSQDDAVEVEGPTEPHIGLVLETAAHEQYSLSAA